MTKDNHFTILNDETLEIEKQKALEIERQGELELTKQLSVLYEQKVFLNHTKVQQAKNAVYEYAAIEDHDKPTLFEMEKSLSILGKYPQIFSNDDIKKKLGNKGSLNQINLGHPEIEKYSGRGRRSYKTQYDLAYERRKGLFHKLVRLPTSGAKGRLKIGVNTLAYIQALAEQLDLFNIPKRHRVREFSRYIELNPSLQHHDRKTISQNLKKLGY